MPEPAPSSRASGTKAHGIGRTRTPERPRAASLGGETIEKSVFPHFEDSLTRKISRTAQDYLHRWMRSLALPPKPHYMSNALRSLGEQEVYALRFLEDLLIDVEDPRVGCVLSNSFSDAKATVVYHFANLLIRARGSNTRVLVLVSDMATDMWARHGKLVPRKTKLRIIGPEARSKGIREARTMIATEAEEPWTGVFVLTYSTLQVLLDSETDRAHTLAALIAPGADAVVLDDAHQLRTQYPELLRVLRRVATRRRVALTWKPVMNHLFDYQVMAEFVAPGALELSSDFEALFVRPITDGHCHDSSKDEYAIARRAGLLLMNRLASVSVPLVRNARLPRSGALVSVLVHMEPTQGKFYNEIAKLVSTAVTRGHMDTYVAWRMLQLAASHMHALRTMAEELSSARMKDAKQSAALERIASNATLFRSIVARIDGLEPRLRNLSSKLSVVCALVDETLDTHRHVLVLSQTHELATALYVGVKHHLSRRRLDDLTWSMLPPRTHASMSDHVRCFTAARDWRESTDGGVLITTLSALHDCPFANDTTGLRVVRRIIFADSPWDSTACVSALTRLAPGSAATTNIEVYRLVAASSAERRADALDRWWKRRPAADDLDVLVDRQLPVTALQPLSSDATWNYTDEPQHRPRVKLPRDGPLADDRDLAAALSRLQAARHVDGDGYATYSVTVAPLADFTALRDALDTHVKQCTRADINHAAKEHASRRAARAARIGSALQTGLEQRARARSRSATARIDRVLRRSTDLHLAAPAAADAEARVPDSASMRQYWELHADAPPPPPPPPPRA